MRYLTDQVTKPEPDMQTPKIKYNFDEIMEAIFDPFDLDFHAQG